MKVNNFITQARIDDEKFTQVVQRYRNLRTEMNLQYCKLRRKTFSSIYSIPKSTNCNVSTSSIVSRKPAPRSYVHLNKKISEDENSEQKKSQNIFVVTTVRVKARRPETTDIKLNAVKKQQNPIHTPKVRSKPSRNNNRPK